MQIDVADLRDFYATPLGQVAAKDPQPRIHVGPMAGQAID